MKRLLLVFVFLSIFVKIDANAQIQSLNFDYPQVGDENISGTPTIRITLEDNYSFDSTATFNLNEDNCWIL